MIYTYNKSVIKGYGFLYNWYAATNASPICASNAHVPSDTEWTALTDYLGGLTVAGGKMKEIGSSHWALPNTGADNSSGFTAIPAGIRPVGGAFIFKGAYTGFWATTEYEGGAYVRELRFDSAAVIRTAFIKSVGTSISLIIDTPIEIDGTQAIYVGNDGRRYNCVLINSIWWLAENLAETRYRNDLSIPIVTDNGAWDALITGGMCAYDNNPGNV